LVVDILRAKPLSLALPKVVLFACGVSGGALAENCDGLRVVS